MKLKYDSFIKEAQCKFKNICLCVDILMWKTTKTGQILKDQLKNSHLFIAYALTIIPF